MEQRKAWKLNEPFWTPAEKKLFSSLKKMLPGEVTGWRKKKKGLFFFMCVLCVCVSLNCIQFHPQSFYKTMNQKIPKKHSEHSCLNPSKAWPDNSSEQPEASFPCTSPIQEWHLPQDQRFCPALPNVRPVFPRLDQDSSLDGAETVSVLRCFRENFWISIYILKYKSPALSTLLISKSQGFFWGGFLP